MASQQNQQATAAATGVSPASNRASRRKVLLIVGGILGVVVVYFGALTLLSSTRWLDFSPAAGTISAAPERVAEVAQVRSDAPVTRMALSPDGALLAAVNTGKPGITLYQTASGNALYTLNTGSDVLACAFSTDSKIVVTVNSSQQIQVWNAPDGSMRYPALAVGHQPVAALRLTNDGQRLMAASQDGSLAIWQIDDGRELRVSNGHLPTLGTGPATFSENGSVLASSDPARGITILSMDSEEARNVIDAAAARVPFAGLTFSHTGALLATRDTSAHVQIFRATTGELVRTLTWAGKDAADSPVQSIAFVADGRLLALGGRDGSIELWDVEGGTLRSTLSGHTQAVNALDFSVDGRSMASASDDNTMRLWRLH